MTKSIFLETIHQPKEDIRPKVSMFIIKGIWSKGQRYQLSRIVHETHTFGICNLGSPHAHYHLSVAKLSTFI